MSGVNAKRLPEIEARRVRIMALRAEGLTWAAIGHELGVSPDRARVLHVRALEVEAERAAGISARARQIIDECGVGVEGLRARLARSQAEVERVLRRRAMCGARELAEILAWLGREDVSAQ
ncbi:hypothetical protein [Sphingomonas colocasiae]|uniref:Uncharacterized protein n=1 Tax=Sphingomonas colocasiae TaxID=1848973 RepID=A0ABS7PPZ3_9SPHN|nr:hypothetical protein [Sphingomonas colocasiae]MBY8823261.1 hypothetical protein [Sphingomonas colocasiae]